MNKVYIILIICISFFSCNQKKEIQSEKPVKLILDTDIGPDFDDVGAMTLMHALADSSQVEILATISSNHHELVVPTIQILNNYFNRPNIPVGAPKSKNGVSLTSDHIVKWPEVLVQKYPTIIDSTSKAPDAVKTYRKILSSSNDKSVTICTIGFLTNLRDLLVSGSDEYSELTGRELVTQKVKHLVAMAGRFPDGREYNVYKDSIAGYFAINEWPTEIIFSGWEIGSEILTGKQLIQMNVENSPVKDVFSICMNEKDFDGRMSWDQTAVLVAIKGYEPYFDIEQGSCTVFEDGSNIWNPGKTGKHFRLIEKLEPSKMAAIIENYMMHQPFKK